MIARRGAHHCASVQLGATLSTSIRWTGTAEPAPAKAGDANGNRLSNALSGTTTYNYSNTSNLLNSLSGTTTVSYTYDSDGHLTSDGTNSWSYDDRGRMKSATAGGVTTYYGINGLGQRISKWGSGVPNGGVNEYVYDLAGHLIGEYDSSGTIIEETVYLGDLPVAVLEGTGGSAHTGFE